MLQPVKYKTAVDTAIETIGGHIAGNMKEGDVLPSERELAEQLQISRNITREALQHFRTLGIIESRPKTGAVVTRLLPEDVYANYRPFLAVAPHTFHDLLHLRLILELGCAEKAVANASARDIEELDRLSHNISALYEKQKLGKGDFDGQIREDDMNFHTKIMKLSHNVLIDSMIPLVVEFFEEKFLKNMTSDDSQASGYMEHFDMVRALENRDVEKLTALLRSHLNRYSIGNMQSTTNNHEAAK